MRVVQVDKEKIFLENENDKLLMFSLENLQKKIKITEDDLSKETKVMKSVDLGEDTLLAIIENSSVFYYLHVKNHAMFITRYLNGKTEGSIELNIESYHPRFQVAAEGYTYNVIDQHTKSSFQIDHTIFMTGHKPLVAEDVREENEPFVYMKISACNYHSFIEYTISKKVFSIKTSLVKFVINNSQFKIDFISANQFDLKQKEFKKTLKVSALTKNKNHVLAGFSEVNQKDITIFKINKRMYVISTINNQLVIRTNTRAKLFLKELDVDAKKRNQGFVITGKISSIYPTIQPDSLISSRGLFLGKIEWLSENNFQVEITGEQLEAITSIHTHLQLGYDMVPLYALTRVGKEPGKKNVYVKLLTDKKVYLIRLTEKDTYALSMVPSNKVYNKSNQLKIKLAYYMSKIIKPLYHQGYNLYFEKQASKADESAKTVFDQVKTLPKLKSKNYYVLDKDSKDYPSMKEKHGLGIIDRFSFKHYLSIFLAKNFISSELSAHVVDDRVYVDLLNNKIKVTPLYFLQHGIMFAKPVDNPKAQGFYKENMQCYMKKSVISSDLEAKEFYKMGYDDNDLMKTGLAKLDVAKLDISSDKIVYMPTYRYWEESLVLNGKMEETTYYKAILEVINAFEEKGLINRLVITPHNKFAEHIYETLPQYSEIISTDPTEALKIARIFITDYSSAIYDGTYRGAYPIFYWKEADYLIEKYQAIPPVNEENAPGYVAKTAEELMFSVQQAINDDYQISKEVTDKYRAINEFHDNKNTERIIDELLLDKVL